MELQRILTIGGQYYYKADLQFDLFRFSSFSTHISANYVAMHQERTIKHTITVH